ncbi:secretin N-terminal domain-containing protein [Novipirellula sp. SH528]|uniref:secretin N-terminal domain-containing protein n=1 Tax=Novipirellula sp. SH528 TaxID=3454466 RepID=UPI003F9F0031
MTHSRTRRCSRIRLFPAFVFVAPLLSTSFLSPLMAQEVGQQGTAQQEIGQQETAQQEVAVQTPTTDALPLDESPTAEQPTAEQPSVETSTVETSSPLTPSTDAAPAVVSEPAIEITAPPLEDGMVRFSFEGVPWREVIRWIADEAGLALHFGDLPPGSFTYTDPTAFSHQQAIDRVNLFLLSEGFTLVRSDQLLSVINLSDPRSLQQLDVLAKLISVEDLADTSEHHVVKCMFSLGDIDAEEAVQELAALKLMSSPAILSRTNQLMITDTVAKLRNVQAVLAAFQPADAMQDGTIVKSFSLQHVEAEDILVVARPHLGLATDEMIGIDVSISADLQGKNLFVTGLEDKVKLIEGLVAAIDKPKANMTAANGDMLLKSHLVEGGNVETVYNVLQTLLAGKQVRLSVDQTASSVVALASPEVQAEIAETVAQLQASEADFEVIQLKTVDPYFAISLLEQMLDLPDPLDDPKTIDPDAPKIDADPGNMRLFVRAKRAKIDQIKKIVAGLEVNSDVAHSENTRMFPLRGAQAEQLLETATKFWRRSTPIIMYPAIAPNEKKRTERVLHDEESTEEGTTQPELIEQSFASTHSPNSPRTSSARLLTATSQNQADAIRCQLTPRGVLMQSDDPEALNEFESHLRSIAGVIETAPVTPIVFYLKHTKPDDALRMLGELLDGGDAAKEAQAGTLVNGYVSGGSSSGLLSSFVTSNDGTTTMMSGTITIVADSRLNRLIAQGTSGDIDIIEGYLKIIDKDQSITSIETYGTSNVIELVNTKASEVAEAIREAYAGRISSDKEKGQAGGSAAAVAAQRAAEAKLAAAAKKGLLTADSKPDRDLEPKMTVAVHEASNSLIVTAPRDLFNEVEKLAKHIDARGEQTIEVITPMNSDVFGELLHQVILGEGTARSSSSRSRSTR